MHRPPNEHHFVYFHKKLLHSLTFSLIFPLLFNIVWRYKLFLKVNYSDCNPLHRSATTASQREALGSKLSTPLVHESFSIKFNWATSLDVGAQSTQWISKSRFVRGCAVRSLVIPVFSSNLSDVPETEMV